MENGSKNETKVSCATVSHLKRINLNRISECVLRICKYEIKICVYNHICKFVKNIY